MLSHIQYDFEGHKRMIPNEEEEQDLSQVEGFSVEIITAKVTSEATGVIFITLVLLGSQITTKDMKKGSHTGDIVGREVDRRERR